MKYSLPSTLFSTLTLSLALPLSALAAPINQHLPLPDGSNQQGSNNHTKMAKGGRYVPFTSIGPLFIRDIKTQITTSQLSTGDSNFFSISPSGRYVAFFRRTSFNAPYTAVILDRVTQTETIINAEPSKNIGLSDNGYAFFNRINGTDRQLVRYNIKTQQEELVGETQAALGDSMQPHPLSSDGKIGLFSVGNVYKIYNAATKQVTTLNPVSVEGWGLAIYNASARITLSSNGKFVAFKISNLGPAEQNSLFVLNLESPTQTAVRFPMTPKNVEIDGGFSVSRDARFISFTGRFLVGHPDWAAANLIAPSSSGYPAVFRYDTVLDQLVNMSKSNTGGPLESKEGTCCIPLQPLLNSTSVLSDDGSMVEFATSSPNVSSVIQSAAEVNYHAYVSNGFARNYQFLDMPNTDTNFKSYARMTLVGNNQWEGTLSFDGVGAESFKFDAGGTLVNGKFTATPDFGINFGAGSTAGQAVSNGGNIPVTGGAGDYTVTFNDQTLKYTITKQDTAADWKRTVVMIYGQTQTGQDMFIRGGLDHQKALAILGKNCDANNALCSMPIRYTNTLNPTTAPWKQGDTKLDWQGVEAGQGSGAQGSPLDWTTDIWPSSWGAKKTVAINGYGETPLNLWGQHYWLLDVEMDCSKTYNGWFELKSFISNGPGWEANVAQANTPWASNNHFAQCGKMNVFKRGQSAPVLVGGTL